MGPNMDIISEGCDYKMYNPLKIMTMHSEKECNKGKPFVQE